MDSKYPILALGILTSVIYLISYLFAKTGLISKVLHCKIWNVVLLLSFLTLAVLAILLVINLNYKLEWESFDGIQKWHVDFGIVLSFVAIFHFLEHLSYYLNLFKPKKTSLRKNDANQQIISSQNHSLTDQSISPKVVSLEIIPENFPVGILLLGFLSTSIQVLFVRELTTLFQGNELYMAWTIGAWMLLTGIGTYWGSQRLKAITTSFSIQQFLVLISVIPFVLVLILDSSKPLIFLPGILIHPLIFLLITIILLAPVCLLSGFGYALLIRRNNHQSSGIIRVYAFEAIGSLLGGIIVSLVLIRWINMLTSLLMLALFGTIVLFSTIKQTRKTTGTIAVLAAILFAGFFIFPIELQIKSLQYINQQVLESRETYHGNLTITENSGQYNFYQNGILIFTTNNMITNEETVHYAMLQHDVPKTVLLVSGGVEGMASEVLKYPSVEQVDYVELNPELIKMTSKYSPLPQDQRLKIIDGDAYRLLKKSKVKYDVVLFAVPPPSSLQYNRYYTSEFLKLLKKRLNSNAVISFGLAAAGNYQSSESVGIEASVYHSLKTNFRNVIIVPGEKDYFIASDHNITNQISALSKTRNVENSYVNDSYIDDSSISQRAKLIRQNIEIPDLKNTDKKPLPVFYYTLQFISQFSRFKALFLIIPSLLLLIPLFFMTPVSGGMYVAGFTASSVELLLIFLFQVVFGYLYSAIGLIIALFMGGLAMGALAGKRITIGKKQFIGAQSLLAIYALLFPLFWKFQTIISSGFGGWLFFVLLILIPAMIVGFQYVASSKRYNIETQATTIKKVFQNSISHRQSPSSGGVRGGEISHGASVVYSADLLGGALGTVLVTLVLIPFIGINNTCYVIAGANVLVVAVNLIRNLPWSLEGN